VNGGRIKRIRRKVMAIFWSEMHPGTSASQVSSRLQCGSKQIEQLALESAYSAIGSTSLCASIFSPRIAQ
jgi:hypothetical protein